MTAPKPTAPAPDISPTATPELAYFVEGMDCASCVHKVEAVMARLPGAAGARAGRVSPLQDAIRALFARCVLLREDIRAHQPVHSTDADQAGTGKCTENQRRFADVARDERFHL